jgi:hypothetical protein
MGYARHIGRVGALAVTLGVGVAIVTMPGAANAGPTDSSTSTGGSSSSAAGGSSPNDTSSGADGADGAAGANGAAGADGAAAPEGAADDGDDTADGDLADSGDGDSGDGAADLTGAEGDEETPSGGADSLGGDGDQAGDLARGAGSNNRSTDQQDANRSLNLHASSAQDDSDEDRSAPDLAGGAQAAMLSADAGERDSTGTSLSKVAAGAPMKAATFSAALDTPEVPQQRATFVSVVADFVAAVLNPLLGTGGGLPFQMPILTAILSVARDELERIFVPRSTTPSRQQTVSVFTTDPDSVVDPLNQHVLLIGVDGTNLSRILADPENDNFFELMDEGTTAASSIVGHTTISNPSWTAILTGVWGERTGVINNVFTPGTYDKFPTIFNQLEGENDAIKTMAIADWDVIGGIAQAGSDPADVVTFVPQIEGDTNWLYTDDAVGLATKAAIESADPPNFLFSYFVGVDENGHMYGGASEQYKLAIENVDENLGLIMDAAATSGEQWTIIVVTDHGHQPEKGLGHGFQTPDETSTFVIASGADFGEGLVNPEYQIVDTTPTVMNLFGFAPRAGSDGVTLQSLSDSDEDPVNLHQALMDEIATNKSPDALTNVALSLRTVFATVPYYIYQFKNDAGASLPSFLVVPVGLIFDGLYLATNIPAQIVAFATGVSGASIFPLFPPPPPTFPPSEETNVLLVCASPGSAAGACEASVA